MSNDETQRSSLETSLKPMPLRPSYCSMRRFHTGVCSSRRIFDIFRIGVVTSYKEEMWNLLSVFGLKRLPLLSQFHILLFYVLWFQFHVVHFHVLQFHVLSFGPSFSRPAISCPAHWFFNFMTCYFIPCRLVRQFHVHHFHVQHFQRPCYL